MSLRSAPAQDPIPLASMRRRTGSHVPLTSQDSAPLVEKSSPEPAPQSLVLAQRGWAQTALLNGARQGPQAAGDLLTARALTQLSQGQFPTKTLMGLALSQALPHLLSAFSEVATTQWRSKAEAVLENDTVNKLFGRADVWLAGRTDATGQARRTANDLPWVLGMLVDAGGQGLAAAVAVGVQAGIMAYLVDAKLALSVLGAAGIAVALGCASYFAVQRHNESAKVNGIEPHFMFGNARQVFFDNVALGNTMNAERWTHTFNDATNRYATQLLEKTAISEGLGAASKILSGAWVGQAFIGQAQTMWDSGQKESLLTNLLPLAMRSVSLLKGLQDTLDAGQSGLYHLAIYRRLGREITQSASFLPAAKISDRVEVKDKAGQKVPLSQLFAPNPGVGRMTVRGPNGAGKSMLLIALKLRFGDQSFYWPAVNDLMMDVARGSSGETTDRALLHFEQYLASPRGTPVLLFDEWDANLDAHRRTIVSSVLDRLAQNHTVIETTHDASTKNIASSREF